MATIPTQREMKDLLNLIFPWKDVWIAGHTNPDGDCVASMCATYQWLKGLGKSVTLYNVDPIPAEYIFLEGTAEVSDRLPSLQSKPPTKIDGCIIVDCGDLDRIGEELAIRIKDLPKVNIDHHITNTYFGTINMVDPNASSTGEMIYRILQGANVAITQSMAEALYCAVLTDTGSFRYSNATPEAFQMAGEMVGKGVNPWKISEHLYENQNPERIRLLQEVLSTLEIHDRFASIVIKGAMFQKTNTSSLHVDGFINYPRSIQGVEVAVQLREVDDHTYRVSFRSKGVVDVSKIATQFGGGGHPNAAGCEVSGNLDEVKHKVFNEVKRAIQETSLERNH